MKRTDSGNPYDWLVKADADMRAAALLLTESELENAALHIQQAIEKYLKALILYRKGGVRQIHDLTELLKEASEFVPELTEYKDFVVPATAYYINSRYPGEVYSDLSKDDLEEGFSLTKEIA